MTDKEKIKENFKVLFWTQLIDDYGDEHLYDSIWTFIETLLKEREQEVYEKGFNDSSDEMIEWLKNKQGIRVPTK